MKKYYLLMPMVLGLATLHTQIVAEPTVYGKANISLNKHDAEDVSGTLEDNWQLNSNASRLGIKGDLELEDSLKAVYQLEYEVALDDGEFGTKVDVEVAADCDDDDTTKDKICEGSGSGSGSAFKQRNIFVGIEGSFGQVIAGKHDTPLKLSQGKVDRFNDLVLADIKEVISGEVRADNIIIYTAPKMGDFESKLAFIPGEGSEATDDNGIADGFSGSLNYKKDAIWVSLAIDSEVDDMDDNTRLTAEYSFDKAKLAAMVQDGEDVAGTESTAYLISGEYMIAERWTAKAQYATNTDEFTAGGENDTSMFTAGADYKLGEKAKVFAYASSWETDASDEEQSTFGLGTEVNF